jgi:hypothetical protein
MISLHQRVVDHLINELKCVETTSKKVKHPYRKFSFTPNETFFLTESRLFIGETFNNCRPADSIFHKAISSNK